MHFRLQERLWYSRMVFALSLGLPLLTACANTGSQSPSTPLSSSPSNSSAVSVAISPAIALVLQNGSLAYTATVTGTANTGVTWSVQEGATAGSITSAGFYTASNTLGTYHVVATSVADPTARASAAVTTQALPVAPLPESISISPSAATIAQGQSLSCSATVTGVANTAVSWSIQEGSLGGSITSSGASTAVYTAPTGALGTVHVIATSIVDGTLKAVAAVGVEPPLSTATPAGNFTAVGNMAYPRVGHTATLLRNGKVLIAGGLNSSGTLASAELYDPATRTFSPTGSMITPRQYHSATLIADGRILIAGGMSGPTNVYAAGSTPVFTTEIYDPSTGAFTATGDLISTAGSVSTLDPGDMTTLLPDGRVFVAAANNAEIYDPHSGTFTLTGPFAGPSPITPNTVTLLANGKVLVTLSSCTAAGCAGINELFDPQSGTFSITNPMTDAYLPDYGYTAVLLADGRVLFLGSNENGSGDVEVYDPTAGTFASMGNVDSQELAQASRLTDGTVLISGGQLIGGNGSTNAELYVPATGTLEYAGQLTSGRTLHKATALPDDTVLLTGGYTFGSYPNPQPTSSAEIYKSQ